MLIENFDIHILVTVTNVYMFQTNYKVDAYKVSAGPSIICIIVPLLCTTTSGRICKDSRSEVKKNKCLKIYQQKHSML